MNAVVLGYPTAARALPREAERMEAIGRFASGIVHDFNNVLGAIVVYTDVLASHAGDARQRQCAERMAAAAERGRNLVAQLLAYARSESAGLSPTDACAGAASAADLVRELVTPGISLDTHIPAAPLRVMADATQLEQIVTNLCTNAIQAMPHGGALSVSVVSVRFSQRRKLSHGSVAAGPHVALRVEDEGCGMDAETLAHAFEPFYTTRGRSRGTGLGLAIVQALVERFGGAIDVQTTPGAGTAFSIYLPLMS